MRADCSDHVRLDGGGADGLVSNGANWNQGGVAPGAGDSLQFMGVGAPLANKGATFDAAAPANVAMIQVGANYTSTVFVNTNVSVGTLDITGGPNGDSISVDTNITLTASQGFLRSGSIGGGGTVDVMNAPGSSFTVSGASTLSVSKLSIEPQASLNIQADLTFQATQITQLGSANWTGGDVTLGMGAVLTNSGTFTISTSNNLSGTGSFTNTGQVITSV